MTGFFIVIIKNNRARRIEQQRIARLAAERERIESLDNDFRARMQLGWEQEFEQVRKAGERRITDDVPAAQREEAVMRYREESEMLRWAKRKEWLRRR